MSSISTFIKGQKIDDIEFLPNFRKRVFAKVRAKVGKPTISLVKTISDLNELDKNKYPRSFNYAVDMVHDKIIWNSKSEFLAFQNSTNITSSDFIKNYHDNHRLILSYQALRIHELFLDYKDDICSKIYYISKRALSDKNGKYWCVHSIGSPLQQDENGFWISYFLRLILISEYKGEGIENEFYYEGKESEKYSETIRKLNLKLEGIKAETFELLGFNVRREEILKLLAEGISKSDIAESFKVGTDAISWHNRRILERGRELFPINNFSTAKDVADYLRIQGFI